ncbi:unnamed protein product [Closterium sp. NIES-64]|nr:unnamed protein product [Closterium sp. NIES-64]
MGHLRNGDGEGVELSTGKERGLESGEDLEGKEESEELEMSGDAGEENAEKDEEAEEEGEEDEAGEEDEEDTIESVFKEIHAWEGEGSSERDGERHIEGERHRARESRGGVFENSQKPGSAERDGERDIEGDRYRARESTGKGESGSREERSRRWKEAISEMRGEWDVKEARGVRGERRGVSGVPKGVRRGGRTGRRRLVDGWMAGLPENTERTAIEKTSRRGRTRRRRRLVDGWVAGPQEKGESAFRWRNEVGDDEEMLTQHHDSYQWQWPVARLGDSWRGMFMREARYDIANTPSCKGILPPPAYTNLPILGRDANETELKILGNVRRHQEKREAIPMDLLVSWAGVGKETRDPIMEGLLESIPRERWLIWAPRFGLGNSLRGYTSAFIFALLSGRRLLRWHGGAHRMVLERLCDAFYCGLDELHYRGDMRKHTKLMEGRELVIHGLNYYSPVMAVNSGAFFDAFWRRDPLINQCVHDAFGCRSLWCIQSQVLSLLLGKGPRPGVQEVVDRDLRVVPPLVFRGGGMGMEEGEAKGGKVEPQTVAKGEGLRLQFDLSIHIRGHSVLAQFLRVKKAATNVTAPSPPFSA